MTVHHLPTKTIPMQNWDAALLRMPESSPGIEDPAIALAEPVGVVPTSNADYRSFACSSSDVNSQQEDEGTEHSPAELHELRGSDGDSYLKDRPLTRALYLGLNLPDGAPNHLPAELGCQLHRLPEPLPQGNVVSLFRRPRT